MAVHPDDIDLRALVAHTACITISTGHLSVSDRDILTRLSGIASGPLLVARYPEGLFVDTTQRIDEVITQDALNGLSPEFIALYKAVHRSEYALLRFDADGPVVPGLPTFDW